MMHFSWGLLLLCFVSVHGVINKCYIGGVEESNCNEINEGSILRLYISNYGSKSYLEVDEPYRWDYHDFKPSAKSNITLKECTPISLLVLLLLGKDGNLVGEWNEVLNHGTDMHRLKFHNKLVNMNKHVYFSLFTKEDTMIFIKSCYITASMYYLANYQQLGYNVIIDVIYVFDRLEVNLTNLNINLKEFIVWKILCYTLLLNIMESSTQMTNAYSIDCITSVKEKIKEFFRILEQELNEIRQIPCAYILIYQSYFLDKDMDNKIKDYLTNILKSNLIDFENCHSDENLYSMHRYLATTIINPNSNNIDNFNAFSKLMLAIERPVLCIQDRLLNYKATLMMMELYRNCVGENKLQIDLCKAIELLRPHDIKTSNILDKITQLITYDTKTQHIKENLIIEDQIDENFAHMIVTMAIDMDSKSKSYKKKRENVKTTIFMLNEYAQKVNNDILENSIKLYTACKWLLELNAVLCDGSEYSEEFQTAYTNIQLYIIKKSWDKIEDQHLDHIFKKKEYWNNARKIFSWENYSKTGGWIFKNNYFDNIEVTEKYIDEFISGLKSPSPFISYTYILIQLSKYYFETDFTKASMYITEALRMPVITPEDRYRNIEAHEIHGMLFMIHNSKVVQEMENMENE